MPEEDGSTSGPCKVLGSVVIDSILAQDEKDEIKDCIFCKIIRGEIPADIIFKDDDVIAFRDISPMAPTHVLIVPKRHIPLAISITEDDIPLIGKMVIVANRIAIQENVSINGYRLVINCGPQGGQLVPHLHMHLLGGRQLSGKLG